jgi:hypothetical protein
MALPLAPDMRMLWCGACAGDSRLKRRYLAGVAGHNESTRRQLVNRDEHRSRMRLGMHDF